MTLLRLDPTGGHSLAAQAVAGQEFATAEPFGLSFDPAQLLEP